MTIAGVLRWDLAGPISCKAANKLEWEVSAPFNLTVFCKCCSHSPEHKRISARGWVGGGLTSAR